MKTALIILAIASLVGCAIPPDSELNPLYPPGYREPTAAELHRRNVREITGNPTIGLWDELHE